MDRPRIRYARSEDGTSIAYQVFGDGPIDLLWFAGFVWHGELIWEHPGVRAFYERLGTIARVIMFDKRGQGLSDRPPGIVPLEDHAADAIAVLDAVGSERVALFGISEGGPASIMLAAAHPDRIAKLVLWGTYARVVRSDDYPAGIPVDLIDILGSEAAATWGDPVGLNLFAPSKVGDREFEDWWARFLRAGISPAGFEAIVGAWRDLDVRAVLPAINAPTLVMCREGDRLTPPAMSRHLAENIPDARLVVLAGEDHVPMVADDALFAEVGEFLTGELPDAEPDRVLATVLFTDIVDSTARASRLGDRAWGELLGRHDQLVRSQLGRWRGREVKHLGDGFLAAFEGPARAIRCAADIAREMEGLGVEVRAGVHTGECERRGEDLAGMAVHIGARVGAAAGPGEILVSGTVRDLVVGSDIAFEERGEHALKGVPGEWRLFAVA